MLGLTMEIRSVYQDLQKLDPAHEAENSSASIATRVALIMSHVKSLADEASVSVIDPTNSSTLVRKIMAARAERRKFFDGDLFADPAWDMLLELFALERDQRRTCVSSLCIASAVPATTALRWIDKLLSENLIERTADPLDGRRVWISLSKLGSDTMSSYLRNISKQKIAM